jgi:AcrR family transcriptional regulator
MITKVQSEEVTTRGRGRPRDECVRKRILDGALELLEQVGFANATVEGIAERAGASKATVYRWWPNKAAVFIEAFREAVAPELPFADSGSFRDDVCTQMKNFTRMLMGRRGRILAAFIAAAQGDPEVAEALRSLWIAPRRHDAKLALDRNRKRGELRDDIDLDLVLDLIYGPLYYRLLLGHGPLSQDYAETMAELALEGLLATNTKSPQGQ